MKKILYVIIVVLYCSVIDKVSAQFLSDQITGKPITTKSYTDIDGSPYLIDDWAKGSVKLDNGEVYKDNLYLKYNQLNDELYFKGKNDESLAFVNGVKEFTITYNKNGVNKEVRYKNGFEDIPGYSVNTNFEVLADGTVTLVKKVLVTISETKEFNSAVIKKTFEKNPKYYLIFESGVKQTRNERSSIVKALSDKQNDVESYIKKYNLKFKTDSDLAQIVNYYNSI